MFQDVLDTNVAGKYRAMEREIRKIMEGCSGYLKTFEDILITLDSAVRSWPVLVFSIRCMCSSLKSITLGSLLSKDL